jgi:hypothetical protein
MERQRAKPRGQEDRDAANRRAFRQESSSARIVTELGDLAASCHGDDGAGCLSLTDLVGHQLGSGAESMGQEGDRGRE